MSWRPFIFFPILFTYLVLNTSCTNFKKDPNHEITLEIHVRDFLSKMGGENSSKEYFIHALNKTDSIVRIKNPSDYIQVFMKMLKEERTVPLIHSFPLISETNMSDADLIAEVNQHLNYAIERQISVIKQRLASEKIDTSFVKRKGTNKLEIQLYTEDPSRINSLLTENADLYFYEAYTAKEARDLILNMESEIQHNDRLRKKFINEKTLIIEKNKLLVDVEEKETIQEKTSTTELPSKLISGLLSDHGTYYRVEDTADINRIITDSALSKLLNKELSFYWWAYEQNAGEEKIAELVPGYNKTSSRDHWLTGDIIRSASLTVDQAGRLSISVLMNERGALQWKRMTGRLAAFSPENRRIAIVVNNICYTIPVVQSEIPNGEAMISGNFTLENAERIVKQLNSGKLPLSCKVIQVKQQ